MEISAEEVHIYPIRYVRAVIRHMGPEFWIVAAFPFYISWVWGSGEIFPGLQWLEDNPAAPGSYLSTLGGYLANTWHFWLGAIIIGPLLGGGTVLYDDYFDLEADRYNPRKNKLPFQKAKARPEIIFWSSLFLFGVSLLLAPLISMTFFWISALIALLSILYSAPPIRFKGRPGWDMLTNMIGFGVLCSLAGFVIAAPLEEYPWAWLSVMVLGTGTLFLLTTIVDLEADRKGGVRTISVYVGLLRSVELAMLVLLGANIIILSMGLANYLITPGVTYRVWPVSVAEFVPLLYLRLTGNESSVLWVIFGVASLMAFGTFMLCLNYVGIWVV